MSDPEMRDFIARLRGTATGMRYANAWNAMIAARKEIIRMEGLEDRGTRKIRAVWQRRYQEASEAASRALSDLTLLHDWPKDSLADGEYIYLPPARTSRRKRRKRKPLA